MQQIVIPKTPKFRNLEYLVVWMFELSDTLSVWSLFWWGQDEVGGFLMRYVMRSRKILMRSRIYLRSHRFKSNLREERLSTVTASRNSWPHQDFRDLITYLIRNYPTSSRPHQKVYTNRLDRNKTISYCWLLYSLLNFEILAKISKTAEFFSSCFFLILSRKGIIIPFNIID